MVTKAFLSGGVNIATDIYRTSSASAQRAVVLAYGSDGLVDNKNGAWATMIRKDAVALAEAGIVALVPDYFLISGTLPNSIDYQRDGALIVMKHRDEWQTAVADALQYAKTLSGVDSSRTGLLGYSLGGHLCLRLRTQAKAVVAFFPPWLDGIGPGAARGVPIDIHYGDKDFLDVAGNAALIQQELLKEGAVVRSHCYPGAGHGFGGNDPANSSARAKSKASTLEFFEVSL